MLSAMCFASFTLNDGSQEIANPSKVNNGLRSKKGIQTANYILLVVRYHKRMIPYLVVVSARRGLNKAAKLHVGFSAFSGNSKKIAFFVKEATF